MNKPAKKSAGGGLEQDVEIHRDKCQHGWKEMLIAIIDGLCPICEQQKCVTCGAFNDAGIGSLETENEALRDRNARLNDTLVTVRREFEEQLKAKDEALEQARAMLVQVTIPMGVLKEGSPMNQTLKAVEQALKGR